MPGRTAALTLVAALAVAAALPTAAPAASRHLTPSAYAALVRLHDRLGSAPHAGTNDEVRAVVRRMCEPLPSPSADRQTRWISELCQGTADGVIAYVEQIECEPSASKASLRCLVRSLRHMAAASRRQLMASDRLIETLLADCRTYFRDGRAPVLELATASTRLADSLERGDAKGVRADLRRWNRAWEGPETTAAEERRAQRLVHACDPS
jgi:hypothetical protein